MNNSKKTIKGPQEVKKEKKAINPKIWIIVSVILSLVLVGSLIFDQLYKRVLVKIDDEKYHLSDLSYYFYSTEYQYDSLLKQLYGGNSNFWNMSYDQTGSSTIGDKAKEEALNSAITTEILYKEALANNYTLTEDENKTIATDVDNLLTKQMTAKIIKKNGFTKEYLTKEKEKETLAVRYRKDLIDKLDIDDAAITKSVSKEDNRQYDIEYLFISKQIKDSNGTSAARTDAQKADALKRINSLYETAKTTQDWSTLVPKDDKELQYLTGSFTKIDSKYTEDFKTKVMTLENKAISAVIENDTGYYIVRMTNNNNSASYDSAVKTAITNAENTAFQNEYETEIATKHPTKLNTNALRALKMGSITLAE